MQATNVYLLARKHGYDNAIAARIEYYVRCCLADWDEAVARAFQAWKDKQ